MRHIAPQAPASNEAEHFIHLLVRVYTSKASQSGDGTSQIECRAHTRLDFPLQDDRIAGSAARRNVAIEARRVQSRTAVLLHDAASTEQSDDKLPAASCYQWPVAVQLPDDAPATSAFRGIWPGAPSADVM